MIKSRYLHKVKTENSCKKEPDDVDHSSNYPQKYADPL